GDRAGAADGPQLAGGQRAGARLLRRRPPRPLRPARVDRRGRGVARAGAAGARRGAGDHLLHRPLDPLRERAEDAALGPPHRRAGGPRPPRLQLHRLRHGAHVPDQRAGGLAGLVDPGVDAMSSKRLWLLPMCLPLLGVAPFNCTPGFSDWGFDAIEELQTPADPPLQCSFTLPADTKDAQRQACAFERGDLVSESLDLDPGAVAKIPIRHVIFMMKENRRFDHLFGKLHDEGQPGTEAIPADFTNPDLAGNEVAPFHLSTSCLLTDPSHQGAEMRRGLAGGTMRGWVENAALTTGTDGHFVMGFNDSADLPFYYWLANTYALSDRHFAPMASGTFSNRNFYLFGTNAGVLDTGITFPDPSTPSVLQTLMNAGFTW